MTSMLGDCTRFVSTADAGDVRRMGTESSSGDGLSRAVWRKSSRSGANGGQCVELAGSPRGIVALRDSKNPSGVVLVFTADEWRAFLGKIRRGELDDLA